jgi:hypothetical protein
VYSQPGNPYSKSFAFQNSEKEYGVLPEAEYKPDKASITRASVLCDSSGISAKHYHILLAANRSIRTGITSFVRWSRNSATVLSLFLHAGHPGTTTPFPPCATDGGLLTKYDKSCLRISFWIKPSSTDFCTGPLQRSVQRKRGRVVYHGTGVVQFANWRIDGHHRNVTERRIEAGSAA